MTAENFVYWLQGYAEISRGAPTEEQWEVIKRHIELVLVKKTGPAAFAAPDRKDLERMLRASPAVPQVGVMTC